MMKSTLYFATTPPLQDLCTVVVKLATSNNQELPATLKVQPQVIKCRELIFMDGRIIATPSLQEKSHIYVILQQSYWKTGLFQGLCRKLGLEFVKPVRVISAVFQSCFSYTLKAKLAPLWNKVGEFYLNGRDFLTNPGPLPAVNIDLNVTETEICLALKGFGVYLSETSLSSFYICESVLAQFKTNRLQTIPEFAIQEKWSHVLPSMKKGKVISVTRSIPSTSPFSRYKDMRRYWKNAYGYRLPEEEDTIFYYNIQFPMIGSNMFTYPSLCVRRSEPRVIPRINPDSILVAFLRDMKTKMPSVCEIPLQFSEEAKYTKGVMAAATLQVHLLSANNITSTPPQPTRWMPTRNLDSIPATISKVPQVVVSMERCSSRSERVSSAHIGPERCSSQSERVSSAHIGPNAISSKGLITQSERASPAYIGPNATSGKGLTEPIQYYSSTPATKKPFSFQDEVEDTTRVQQLCTKKTVPMFKVHRPSQSSQHAKAMKTLISNSDAPRIIPTFKSSKRVKATPPSHTVEMHRPSNRNFNECIKMGARGKHVQSPSVAARRGSGYATSQEILPNRSVSDGRLGSSYQAQRNSSESSPVVAADYIGNCNRVSGSLGASQETCHQQPLISSPMVSMGNPESIITCHEPSMNYADHMGSTQPKRNLQSKCASHQPGTTTGKKQRLQSSTKNLDIELLAISNQLHKVNAMTLATWLRSKNIYIKSREKKAYLVKSVMDYITAQKSET